MARNGTESGVVILFAAAALVVLSRNPVWQDSDGLIGTLFSIQHMTLFFWGQDRFANLIPALATPIHDPEINAYAQLVARVCFGVLAPLFACVFLMRTTWDAWLATLASITLLLMCAPHVMQHDAFIQASPYGTSFALAGLSLLACRSASRLRAGPAVPCRLVGLLLATAAFLVNYTLVIVVAPILIGEFFFFGTELALSYGVVSLIALVLSIMAMRYFGGGPTTPDDFGSLRVGLTALAHELVGAPGRFIMFMLIVSLALHVWCGVAGTTGRAKHLRDMRPLSWLPLSLER